MRRAWGQKAEDMMVMYLLEVIRYTKWRVHVRYEELCLELNSQLLYCRISSIAPHLSVINWNFKKNYNEAFNPPNACYTGCNRLSLLRIRVWLQLQLRIICWIQIVEFIICFWRNPPVASPYAQLWSPESFTAYDNLCKSTTILNAEPYTLDEMCPALKDWAPELKVF